MQDAAKRSGGRMRRDMRTVDENAVVQEGRRREMKVKEKEYYICDICNKRIELASPPYVGWRGCKVRFKKTVR